jgi:hypothetical protein
MESPAGAAEGAVLLTILDPGLSVVFDPVEKGVLDSAEAMDMSGMEYGADMGGYAAVGGYGGMMPGGMGGWKGATSSGTVKLPERTYRVLVTDQLAGWGRKRGEGSVPSSELPERLQVVAGEFRKLTVSRDLKRVADLQPDWQQRGFFAFRWNNETYDLTRTQAVVVQRLLEASLTDAPAMHEALLLAPAEMSAETRQLEPLTLSLEEAQQRLAESEQQTLAAQFNDGQHPAWGTLIVKGDEPTTYRLAELQTGDPAADGTPQVNVDITIADAGLRVSLEKLAIVRRFVPKGAFFDQSGSISVTPGTYEVIVEDELAGWMMRMEEGEPGPVQYEDSVLEVFPQGPSVLQVSRNLHKMAASFPRGINRGTHFFRWQGETYKLNGEQAPIVAFLLQAYADGEPDLHEARLLHGGTFQGREIDLLPMRREAEEELKTLRDDGHSLNALFDDGKHPAWGTLIVAGEKPNTYRLAELTVEPAAEGASMPSAEADVAGLAITVEDPGLIARLFSADTDKPRQPLHEITDSAIVTLPVGRYDVWVEDRVAGWHRLNIDGEPGPVQYEYDRLRVTPRRAASTDRRLITKRGTTSLKISRDFHKMAAGLWPQYGRAQRFRWQEQSYDLTNEQWPIVAILLQAYADGQPDVHEAQLLSGANFRVLRGANFHGAVLRVTLNPLIRTNPDEALQSLREKGQSLENIFDNGKHPAWGTLIVEGEEPNTYRLAELQVPAVEAATGPAEAPSDVEEPAPSADDRARPDE